MAEPGAASCSSKVLDLSVKGKRAETFVSAPSFLQVISTDLAAGGFYYVAVDQNIICHYCATVIHCEIMPSWDTRWHEPACKGKSTTTKRVCALTILTGLGFKPE